MYIVMKISDYFTGWIATWYYGFLLYTPCPDVTTSTVTKSLTFSLRMILVAKVIGNIIVLFWNIMKICVRLYFTGLNQLTSVQWWCSWIHIREQLYEKTEQAHIKVNKSKFWKIVAIWKWKRNFNWNIYF